MLIDTTGNFPRVLPIQDLFISYLNEHNINAESFHTRTRLSYHLFKELRKPAPHNIDRWQLLCICIGYDFSLARLREWFTTAGYLFTKDYPRYKYEFEIWQQFKNHNIDADEAIILVKKLYGKI